MSHRISHKKLDRDTNARRALLKNLATSLVIHERIVTTKSKAKSLRPFVEKLVTKSKTDTVNSRRFLMNKLDKKSAVEKMLELVGPTFKDRPGGYTRIIKIGYRPGDSGEKALIEFVENISEIAAKKSLEKKVDEKKIEKDTKTKSKVKKPELKTKAKVIKKKERTLAKKETSKK